MSKESEPNETRADPARQAAPIRLGVPDQPGDCALSAREQTRNLVLYGVNVTLVYLAAPVLYVGLMHAALLEKLGTSKTVANLPTSLYFWMTPVPLLVAWYFCGVRQLKVVLVATYLLTALANAGVVAALLLTRIPEEGEFEFLWVPLAVLSQGGVLGGALGVVANYQWEVLGRGGSGTRRGQALALSV